MPSLAQPSSPAMEVQQGSAQPVQHMLRISAPIHCLLARVLPGDPLFSCRQRATMGLVMHLQADTNPKFCKIETITRAAQPWRAASGACPPSLLLAALPVPSGQTSWTPCALWERVNTSGACVWGSHTGWGKDSCPRSRLSGATQALPLQLFTTSRYPLWRK